MIKKAPVQEKVDSVFKQVLGLDPQQNREALVYNQIQEWDFGRAHDAGGRSRRSLRLHVGHG